MTSAVKLFHEKAPGQERLVFLGPNDELLEIWFNALHRPNLMGSVHQARINRVFHRKTGLWQPSKMVR